MPGFVEVRIEAVAIGVSHQPLIDLCVNLNGSVPIVSADELATHVNIKHAFEMRAVDGQASPSGSGTLFFEVAPDKPESDRLRRSSAIYR